jgi:hypothetical protein
MALPKLVACGILAASAISCASAANATVVFADDFNSYAYQLNWVPPSVVWTVPSGSVDLIGETTTQTAFNFYPGHGGYVDLDGSTGAAGALESAPSFAAGSYTLSFDLGGNTLGDVAKTTTISLGNWSTTLTLASDSPYKLYTYTFTTTGGHLEFADNAVGNQNIGNILDNVSLGTAIPEVSTWGMMFLGFAGLGVVASNRGRRTSAALA